MKDKKAPTSDSPGSARQIDTGVTPQHNPSRLTPDRGGGLSEGYIPTEPRDTYMGPPPPCQLSTSVQVNSFSWTFPLVVEHSLRNKRG